MIEKNGDVLLAIYLKNLHQQQSSFNYEHVVDACACLEVQFIQLDINFVVNSAYFSVKC